MEVQTVRELAALVRSRRKQLGMSQMDLATSAGVGRQWIIDLEKGKSTVELRLVLHTLRALGLVLAVDPASAPAPAKPGDHGIDLNRLLLGDSSPS
ncbi:type II toxin-antitoxin system Y4mF family antitoxin [Luteolibacter sp. Populi]|uniref:type II toxin-antitoxin system Y4mF family antitoxin n=1 Tax=Luteolibacter sp. Populi TaxID=3230487 RepID=UPI003465DA88